MAFWGDYHTHTTYSRHGKKLHAKGTVLQNALKAAEIGLKELAITDHGYGHAYGVSDETAFAALKEDCREAERITGVRIYAGLENNLDPRSGKRKEITAVFEYRRRRAFRTRNSARRISRVYRHAVYDKTI